MKAKKLFAAAAAVLIAGTVLTFAGCVSRGADGLDGQDVSIYEIYEATNAARAEEGLDELTFLEFVSEYLSYDGSEAEQLISLQTSINRSLLSAVSVTANFRVSASFPSLGSEVVQSAGSGVIVEVDREEGDMYVITNCHVVYDDAALDGEISNDVHVYLYGQENERYAIPAEVIGASLTYDIAVLRVDDSDTVRRSDAMAAGWTDAENISVGQTVYAIGNAAGEGISATTGIVSVDSEYITIDMGTETEDYRDYRTMRTSVPVYSGNSGGGLFDAGGNLVGIINSKTWSIPGETDDEPADNMSNAIPASVARRVAQCMIDWYEEDGATHTNGVRRALIGVTLMSVSQRAVLDNDTNLVNIVETVEVDGINIGSPANGVLQTGDVITGIEVVGSDGAIKESVEVERIFNVIDTVLAVRAGDTVNFTLVRGGEEMSVSLGEISQSEYTLTW